MKLELDRVSFSYGDKPVLQNVSLTVSPGERIALMGFSGMGKTTILRIMAGLAKPDGGTVSGIPKQGVSMVFQEDRLLEQLTVLDNLALVSHGKPREYLAGLLMELGLLGEADIFPSELSGGMKRRVAIARAIAFDSPLVLLDEPFTGLDSQTRARTASFILRHTPQSILVMVTHDPEEAALLNAEVRTLDGLLNPPG